MKKQQKDKEMVDSLERRIKERTKFAGKKFISREYVVEYLGFTKSLISYTIILVVLIISSFIQVFLLIIAFLLGTVLVWAGVFKEGWQEEIIFKTKKEAEDYIKEKEVKEIKLVEKIIE